MTGVFLMINVGSWVSGRKTTEVKYPSHHIVLRVLALSVTCHCSVYLGYLAEVKHFFSLKILIH